MKISKKEKQKIDYKKLFFELLVVFLGVTAGFFLNNYQIDKQKENIKLNYLASFSNDLTKNIGELEKAISLDSLQLLKIEPKLEKLKTNTLSIDSSNSIIKNIVVVSKIEITKDTYENITNSGNLNIISDYELRNKIVNYYLELAGVEFVDKYFYQYFNDFVMPFVFNNYNILTGEITNKIIIKTTKFANVVAGYYSMINQRLSAYKTLLNKCIDLEKEMKIKYIQ